VGVWTVNEPQDIEAMVTLSVFSIVTDYPGRAQKILLDLGYRWLISLPLKEVFDTFE
jgi:glycerophosphoryl diester phosphodiesterase